MPVSSGLTVAEAPSVSLKHLTFDHLDCSAERTRAASCLCCKMHVLCVHDNRSSSLWMWPLDLWVRGWGPPVEWPTQENTLIKPGNTLTHSHTHSQIK